MTDKLGATGNYPDGRLGPDDEGELQFRIGHNDAGMIFVEFGKPVKWMAMDKEKAIRFAQLLLQNAGVEVVIK